MGIGIPRTNLKPYLAHGALQFFIRGAKGGETFPVGFITDRGLTREESTGFENLVPLGSYATVTTDWQLVTIPLADFSQSGKHWDAKIGSEIVGPFNWTRVRNFFISKGPSSDPTMEFQITNIRIVPFYSAKSAK